MPKLPKISVITPSFNQAQYIERTITSVLEQGYPDLEYIVMDGGSTDGTVEILTRYEDRLNWRSEKDEGQTDAINKGIGQSTGDIIAYLNSDDVYEPGSLLRVGTFFAQHPDVKWLTGRCRIVDERDREVRRPITRYKNVLLRYYSYPLLLVTNPISQPATFWRRQIIDEFGFLDKHQHFVMDYDYWLRIGRKHPPAILDSYLASFRVYATSKTSSSFLRSFRQEIDVAKAHDPSLLLHALHWASYAGISAVYFLLKAFNRSRSDR